MGSSIITLSRDFEYVNMGIYTGKSALMVYLWGAGVAVLLLFLIILLVRWSMVPFKPQLYGIGLIVSGLLFLASSIAQYGITFSGPAGFVVPFGALIMVGVGGWIWWQGRMEEGDGEQDEPWRIHLIKVMKSSRILWNKSNPFFILGYWNRIV